MTPWCSRDYKFATVRVRDVSTPDARHNHACRTLAGARFRTTGARAVVDTVKPRDRRFSSHNPEIEARWAPRSRWCPGHGQLAEPNRRKFRTCSGYRFWTTDASELTNMGRPSRTQVKTGPRETRRPIKITSATPRTTKKPGGG